jgi:orotate phosphoribosyltransferase
MKSMSQIVLEKYGKPDVIAGVATGAIAIGMLVAQELEVPFVYVRPEAKKHGRQNQIEGFLPAGSNVVVIEDLISTGKSSLHAVEALNKANVNVLGMLAIFTYGFGIADENFEALNVELTTLSNYEHLIALAVAENFVSKDQLETLELWRKEPSTWNQ